jgi:hypothetical protein
MSFRRANVLRYGSWVANCIHILSQCSSFTDSRLVKWARLQRIAEESLAVVGVEDGPSLDMSDARTDLIVEQCINQVVWWKQFIPKRLLNSQCDDCPA